jgi:hypothetical protein
MPRDPFRKEDLHNLPLLEGRRRFLDKLAEQCPILEELFGSPLSVWISLSDAARDLCCSNGWGAIDVSPNWTNLNPALAAKNAAVRDEQQIHLEIIPLYDSLCAWASKFELLHKGAPATWAMDTAIETLCHAAGCPKRRRVDRWFHTAELSQEYPAVTEPGWINAVTGMPEEELFDLWIKIPPKQPNESFKEYRKRFNNTCREAREQYIRALKADHWTAKAPYRNFVWIDRFAQWQAGHSASEIDPSIKTPSDRATFSRGIKITAAYIGITPRVSGHDPKRRRGH